MTQVSAISRSDFNQSVIHLTRDRLEVGTGKSKRVVKAFDVLKEIMTSATIRGSGNSGFVKGTTTAACFSEIPLSAVREFASRPSDPTNRYRFYGIAMSKKSLFEVGGRPVIYIPDSEADWIPPSEKWRQVRFEHGSVDYTHEREWRSPGNLDLKKVVGLYLIVWSAQEAHSLQTFKSSISHLIRGILPMEHLTMML